MVADFGIAGIDVQRTEYAKTASVEDSLVVGYTNQGNSPNATMNKFSRGLFLPRTDDLTIRNISFWNLGGPSSAAV